MPEGIALRVSGPSAALYAVSMPSSHTFSIVTPAHFARIRLQAAESLGMPIEGDQGEITKSGVTVAWNYRPAAQTLYVECKRAPMFVPESFVLDGFRKLVVTTDDWDGPNRAA